MNKLLFILLSLFSFFSGKSQTILWDDNSGFQNQIENFKDSFKLDIHVNKVFYKRKVENVKVIYSEYFKDESSIMPLSDQVAFRLSVARAINNGSKVYLYKIHLFEKSEYSWKELTTGWCWDQSNPHMGNSIGSLKFSGIGIHGAIGFDGEVFVDFYLPKMDSVSMNNSSFDSDSTADSAVIEKLFEEMNLEELNITLKYLQEIELTQSSNRMRRRCRKERERVEAEIKKRQVIK